MEENKVRHCGNGWAYCNGKCTVCNTHNYYTTTNTVPTVPQYSNETITNTQEKGSNGKM